MNKFVIIIIGFCVLFSCKSPKNEHEKYNHILLNLIFSNQILKNDIERIFELKDTNTRVFKVLVSRRNSFVRITIYRLVNKEEIEEYPSSYFYYDSKIFLCYDGSEIINNTRLDKKFMANLSGIMKSGYTNDSRVFQFDIDYNKKVKVNLPAINPYDFDFKPNKMDKNLFPPPNSGG